MTTLVMLHHNCLYFLFLLLRFGDISLQERINQKNFEMLEAYYKLLSEKVPTECKCRTFSFFLYRRQIFNIFVNLFHCCSKETQMHLRRCGINSVCKYFPFVLICIDQRLMENSTLIQLRQFLFCDVLKCQVQDCKVDFFFSPFTHFKWQPVLINFFYSTRTKHEIQPLINNVFCLFP